MLHDMHHPYILNHYGACFDRKPVRAGLQSTCPLPWPSGLLIGCELRVLRAGDAGQRGALPPRPHT